MYTDIPNNPKVQRLPGPLFKFWINCLCLYGKKGFFPPAADIAWALQLPEAAALKNIRSLIDARLLEESKQDVGFENLVVDAMHPHDWDDLQFESDTSRERQKAYRDRHSKQKRDVMRDVTVTAQEAETDTEQRQSRAETEARPSAPRGALAVIDGTHPTVILTELKEIYHRAGLPIAPKHEQLSVQYLLDIPPEKRHRVSDYVKHCLLSGKWRGASTTKSLLNLLRDGDWDVEIVERDLPPGRSREPSRREANTALALEIFKRERGEA